MVDSLKQKARKEIALEIIKQGKNITLDDLGWLENLAIEQTLRVVLDFCEQKQKEAEQEAKIQSDWGRINRCEGEAKAWKELENELKK